MPIREVRNLLSDGDNNEQYLQHPLPSNNGVLLLPMFIVANCSWSFLYGVINLCVSLLPHVYFFTMCVLLSSIL
jgi:hypothetical protein